VVSGWWTGTDKQSGDESEQSAKNEAPKTRRGKSAEGCSDQDQDQGEFSVGLPVAS